MLLSLYFDCPTDFPHLKPEHIPSNGLLNAMTPPEPLRCPNATDIETTSQAPRSIFSAYCKAT